MKYIEFLFYAAALFFLFSYYSESETEAPAASPYLPSRPKCWCYSYYNKHAARKDRITQTTCDSSILQLSDRFEIFKFKTHCK